VQRRNHRILANLEELSQEITEDDLTQLLSWYPHKSSLQRFGFLIDYLETNTFISDEIFNKLKIDAFYSILLSPKKGIKAGKTGNRWKVDVNIKLENDL
jgi:predicted transcriptional regulator of viral defense system